MSANETNSNADACCLGDNFAILEHSNRQADVHACDKSIKPLLNVSVVSSAAAWDDPTSNQTHILVVNEALHCSTKSDHSPMNPNQIQSFGIDHWDDPFDKSRPISIGPVEHDPIIPLTTTGTKIQFLFREPTSEELLHCPRIQLTSKIDWNPTQASLNTSSSSQGNSPEDSMDNCSRMDNCPHMILSSSLRRMNSQVSRLGCDSTLKDIPPRQSCTPGDRHSEVSAEVLADRFAVGIGKLGQP